MKTKKKQMLCMLDMLNFPMILITISDSQEEEEEEEERESCI
jgi:hypothetical protein